MKKAGSACEILLHITISYDIIIRYAFREEIAVEGKTEIERAPRGAKPFVDTGNRCHVRA